MRIKSIVGTASTCVLLFGLVSTADATLISRLGGQAYYDDVADLSWLADANNVQTTGITQDGLLSWNQATAWAAGLEVAGVTGWRLPDTLLPDASCSIQTSSYSYGDNCTGSEMGNLFYNVLGNTLGSLSNTGPFSNVQSFKYHSATETNPGSFGAFSFDMGIGQQQFNSTSNSYHSWAVQSGDVGEGNISAVPVPAAGWLMLSGLLGLVGVFRRNLRQPVQ